MSRTFLKPPSARIRFHIVFIETASFFLRLHENDQKRWSFPLKTVLKTVSKVERFENDIVIMISLSCRRVVFTENANIWERFNNNHKLFKLSWHANNSFSLVVPFQSFSSFLCRRLKTTSKRYEKRCVDAMQSLGLKIWKFEKKLCIFSCS